MNTEEIYNRYERNLMHIGAASDAVRMALLMAIEETTTAVKSKYHAHLDSLDTWLRLSGQSVDGYGVIDTAINTLTTLNERNAAQADMITSLRKEADELRQQLMQLDADNAALLHELQKAGQLIYFGDVTAPGKVSVEAVAKKLAGEN